MANLVSHPTPSNHSDDVSDFVTRVRRRVVVADLRPAGRPRRATFLPRVAVLAAVFFLALPRVAVAVLFTIN